MGLAASVCLDRGPVPLESGRYQIVAGFSFVEETGGPGKMVLQTVPFDWDAETLTGSVPD